LASKTSDYRPENQFRNAPDYLGRRTCNNLKVRTIIEIQEAIGKLPAKERTALAAWPRSQDQSQMSEREEAASLV
jgi:hypothetical protein